MSYSTATRIHAVWPSRFTVESAQGYVRDPKKLASKVYNGRMGNVPGSDDGYNYRGRGLLQITGRESYRRIGRLTGLPLEDQPGLAYTPSNALTIAAAEFSSLGCLPFCDKDDVRTVTRRVNGGYIGLDSRKAWLAKWKLAIRSSRTRCRRPTRTSTKSTEKRRVAQSLNPERSRTLTRPTSRARFGAAFSAT
jgi:putative chitinase